MRFVSRENGGGGGKVKKKTKTTGLRQKWYILCNLQLTKHQSKRPSVERPIASPELCFMISIKFGDTLTECKLWIIKNQILTDIHGQPIHTNHHSLAWLHIHCDDKQYNNVAFS